MQNDSLLKIFCYGNRTNPPIIFVHGFPFDNSMWSAQVAALKDSHFVITYDIRGLGGSPIGDGQFPMHMFADDLLNILDSLSIKSTAVCGLSMGGYISLAAFEKEPSRFSKLILCDTRADADDNAAKSKRAMNIKNINAYGGVRFVQNFLPLCTSEDFRVNNSDYYNSLLERYSSVNETSLKACQLAMMGRADYMHLLGKIDIPTLVICGEYDSFTPPEFMKNMAAQIKGSEYHTIPNAGHLAPLENPDYTNNLIIDFLNA